MSVCGPGAAVRRCGGAVVVVWLAVVVVLECLGLAWFCWLCFPGIACLSCLFRAGRVVVACG